jgi:hypothetical protein
MQENTHLSNRPTLWKEGQSGNPAGKPKGTLSQKSQQWNALHDAIVSIHAERFNQELFKLYDTDPIVGMRMFLEILNYFKPRLSSVNNNNLNIEGNAITLHIDANSIPLFPSNIEEDGNVLDEGSEGLNEQMDAVNAHVAENSDSNNTV